MSIDWHALIMGNFRVCVFFTSHFFPRHFSIFEFLIIFGSNFEPSPIGLRRWLTIINYSFC